MNHDRQAFHNGVERVLSLQKKLGRPPKKKYIRGYVRDIIKEVNLREDPRRQYFELLATCALLGREPMYNHYRKRRK